MLGFLLLHSEAVSGDATDLLLTVAERRLDTKPPGKFKLTDRSGVDVAVDLLRFYQHMKGSQLPSVSTLHSVSYILSLLSSSWLVSSSALVPLSPSSVLSTHLISSSSNTLLVSFSLALKNQIQIQGNLIGVTSNPHRLSLWVYSFQLFSFSSAGSSDVSLERLGAPALGFLFFKFHVNVNQIEQNIWWTILQKVSLRESVKSRANVDVNMLTNTRKELMFFVCKGKQTFQYGPIWWH